MHLTNVWDELVSAFENSDLSAKISMCCKANTVYNSIDTIWRNGYVRCDESCAVCCGTGEYYVYVWKHLTGLPFYVGSGKNDRWSQKCNRGDRFYSEIDAGDAVVYKVAKGLDVKTARLIERYLSLSFAIAGIKLANGDNGIDEIGVTGAKRWIAANSNALSGETIKDIEKVIVHNVLNDTKCCVREVAEMNNFIANCGRNFFSTNRGRLCLVDA
jgi:hypothetical protein